MATRATKPIFIVLVALGASANAQDAPIDLFEDQSKMEVKSVDVDSTDGGPVIERGEATAPTGGAGGGFTLTFERTGSTILVPASINGRDVYMIFDTGASLTMLTGGFARSAGLVPSKRNPTLQTKTANGMSSVRLGVAKSLELGGRRHGGVTYGLCDGCPGGSYRDKPIVGLLGMNVIGRYRTSFDHGEGVIEMTPSSTYADRWRDIEPWIGLQVLSAIPARRSDDWVVQVAVQNTSPRRIRTMTLRHACSADASADATHAVPARGAKKFLLRIAAKDCDPHRPPEVIDARW